MIKVKRDTDYLRQYSSLEILMRDICLELHLNYISDIRTESNRINVLHYLKKHNIISKNKKTYMELINYIDYTITKN